MAKLCRRVGELVIQYGSHIPSSWKNHSFLTKLKQFDVLKYGVVAEVCNAEQATTAANAGARAVVVRNEFFDYDFLREIKDSLHIPVIGSVRAGFFGMVRDLQDFELVDFIKESKFLGLESEANYVNKHFFDVPIACECGDIKDVLDRVDEGGALIVVQGSNTRDTATKVNDVMERLREILIQEDNNMKDKILEVASDLRLSLDLVQRITKLGKFPVLIFAAGGILKPADVVSMMNLGCAGVFVGKDVFESDESSQILKRMVRVASHYNIQGTNFKV